MSYDESSKNENNSNSKEDENESLEKKQQNLFQVNEIEDEKRKEVMNSLLKKRKKKSEPQDANFDAKNKKKIDGYCKSPKEFGKKNCDLLEINGTEESPQDIQKENIFEPKAFIEKYSEKINSKQPISLEEICLNVSKKDSNIPKSMNLNFFNPETNKIILNGNELMKSMIEKELLDNKQRKEFNELISEIKKMDITKIIKKDKLDIIFDLDNTCTYAFVIKIEDYMNLKKKYPEKNIKLFNIIMNEKNIYFCLIIREGLREFINYAKAFCNFHINILGTTSYGEALKNKLEKELDMKFIKLKTRKDRETKKYLEDLNLELKNCVIFDDQPSVWVKDELNVIISKRFIEKDLICFLNRMGNNQNLNLKIFLSYFKLIINI